jgi:hypothetical protein
MSATSEGTSKYKLVRVVAAASPANNDANCGLARTS